MEACCVPQVAHVLCPKDGWMGASEVMATAPNGATTLIPRLWSSHFLTRTFRQSDLICKHEVHHAGMLGGGQQHARAV